MRWEEIEAGWKAMTNRVRADCPSVKADSKPIVAFLDPERPTPETKTAAPLSDRSMQ